MAVVTRTVSNVGDPLVDTSGNPLSSRKIIFTLVDANEELTDAWAVATGERVIGVTEVLTDANGEFSVELCPNDTLSPETKYRCFVRGTGIIDFYATLASGATTKQWIDFYSEGVTLTAAELSAFQTHINDSTLHAGLGAYRVEVHTFGYGDASPSLIAQAKTGKAIFKAEIHLNTVFNGSAPALSIGDSSDIESVFPALANDPSTIGSYSFSPNKIFNVDTDLNLTITPGAGTTTGSGVIILFMEQ